MKYHGILAAMFVLPAATAAAYEPAGTPDDWPSPMMSDRYGMFLADRLESRLADGFTWDVQGWYGGDRDRWWMKSEGKDDSGGSLEDAELQVLFGRMVAPFWDWQLGIRHDIGPQPDRSYLVLGLQGVAPYEFAIDSALFLGEKGHVSARVETEYDLRITQRLIVQPRFELNAAFSGDPAVGIGSGVNDTELGLRLRYEIRREVAPYIGISWKKRYAETADLAQRGGEPTSVTSLVVGIRAWF